MTGSNVPEAEVRRFVKQMLNGHANRTHKQRRCACCLCVRFSVLSGGRRRQRQRTLEATVAWSYDLLEPEQQRVFRALGVFVGGFDLDAVAGTVGLPRGLVIDVVEALVPETLENAAAITAFTAQGAALPTQLTTGWDGKRRILFTAHVPAVGAAVYSLREANVLIERWRTHYNTKRPHSSLGYRPPAPEALMLKSANAERPYAALQGIQHWQDSPVRLTL